MQRSSTGRVRPTDDPADGRPPQDGPADQVGEAVRIGDDHYRRDICVENESGLHVRPAALLVEVVSQLDCVVTITKGDQQTDATSILELLSMGAEKGSHLVLETKGRDADKAIDRLAAIVSFGRDEYSEGD